MKRNKAPVVFLISIIFISVIYAISALRVFNYNNTLHKDTFTGQRLFSEASSKAKGCTITAIPRGSTWTKVFDFNNEGLTEHNYQAYTYDFTVRNNTDDEVSDFSFKLTFDKELFITQGWNGKVEIHQNVNENEYVAVVPDLRDFNANDYSFDTVTFDGETLIRMNPGDYLIYIPSSDENAMEVPIEPYEGTVPGMILYAPIGDKINGWTLELKYKYHRHFLKTITRRENKIKQRRRMKMRKLLVVIDMQNDFIDGSLGTKEAVAIVPSVVEKIKSYNTKDIFATRDTHQPEYMQTQEGANLPVEHCIIGTKGWEIESSIASLLKDAVIIDKPTFGSTELASKIKEIADKEEIEIELIGLCTDICVVSNALILKAYMPEVKISVDPACCAGVTPKKHLAALETMRSCQIAMP